MSNVLLKKNVRIDVSSKYQTWQKIYHRGSKNAKSGIQTTIDSKNAKLDVNNSSQIVHKYNLEKIDAFFQWLIISNLYPNDEFIQRLKTFEDLEVFDPNFLRLGAKN